MAGKGTPPVEVSADVQEFIRLFGKSSEVPQKLRTALRKRVKAAAEKAAADVRTEVLKSPRSSGKTKRSRGLRRGIAAGVKVSLASTTGATRVGVKIRASGAGLPPEMRNLNRSYNKEKWRHPVFPKAGSKHTALKSLAKNKSTRAGATDLRRALDARRRAGYVWVEQEGRPFFDPVIDKHTDDVQRAVLAAMEEATASLTSGPSRARNRNAS